MKKSSTLTSSRPTLIPERRQDVDDVKRFAARDAKAAREFATRVDPDAEPGHAVGTEDTHDRAEEDHYDVTVRWCPAVHRSNRRCR